jgi:hypothetical protein
MTSLKALLPLLVLCCLVWPACAAADELFSLKAGVLQLSPEGDFSVGTDSQPGTRVDVDNDLGFDDNEDFYLEAAMQLGTFRFFAAYMPISFSGAGDLEQDVHFNGETFYAESRVESKMDLDIYEAGLAWYTINVDDLPIRLQLGPEVAMKYIDAYLEMGSDSNGLRESESVSVALPTLGLRGRLALSDFFGVIGRAGYMEYEDSSCLDIEAQVEFSPVTLVGIFGGFRYLDIEADESDVFIDAKFAGPYVGALIRY